MKVLVINCGSSSLKYQLINMEDESVMAIGLAERIGIDGSVVKHEANGKKTVIEQPMKDHKDALKIVLDSIAHPEYGAIKDMSEISAVGHRVVHGGEKFTTSVVLNDEVKGALNDCTELAPLHNPANLIGIAACEEILGENVPMVVVFDTAFHQTMPKSSFLYGLPYDLYEKYGVRRYGFHGTSHKYVAQRTAQILGKEAKDLKIVTCHLGNGASVAAVENGECVDTSMGFTPLEGLIMGTRCGDIDPAIIPFIMEKEKLDAAGLSDLMNKKSGVLGMTGISSDFRDIEDAANNGDEKAQVALEAYCKKVKKYIGSYAAEMGGVDAIVFTAGIGENSISMREAIIDGLEGLGIKMDKEKNKFRGEERIVSTEDSLVKILVVPTNEELMIARDTAALVK